MPWPKKHSHTTMEKAIRHHTMKSQIIWDPPKFFPSPNNAHTQNSSYILVGDSK